jgi:hypothetical protein
MVQRCILGGILWLLEVGEKFPAEIRADFRSLYGLSFESVGKECSWVEGVHLTLMLLKNPESWLQAAHNDWKYPVSHEWMMLAELFDLTHKGLSKKAKPLKRPWKSANENTIGKPTRSRAVIEARLGKMNPRREPDGAE